MTLTTSFVAATFHLFAAMERWQGISDSESDSEGSREEIEPSGDALEREMHLQAACLRSDTDDDSDSEPTQSSPWIEPGGLWWVSRLQTALRSCGLDKPPNLTTPLKVLSCCTGCSAECEVLKAGHECTAFVRGCHFLMITSHI